MADSSLEIQKSLMGARWVLPRSETAAVEQMMRRHDLPEIVARLLQARGVAAEDVAGFLNPTLRDHFPDPFAMQGMDAMADYLADAIQAQKNIAIFGDFDVDGATSSAVLYRFLKHFGVEARIYIPERLTEGYGPNAAALQVLKDDGAEIVILLDCGTTAFDTVAAGKAMGLDILIFDHHEAETRLPDAVHVINPKRQDDASDLDMLAAVGVTFLACVAVNSKMREREVAEAPLKDWLDLVALGTVCDMVPLTGPNRLFVRHGLKLMERTSHAGLRALMEVAGVKPPLSTYHMGFALGPRINAGSRIHKSDSGARLLATDDPQEAQDIAWLLHDCNEQRKGIQAEMERSAIEKVETQGLDKNSVVLVADEGWHLGLTGLVAGRLKEKYKKPACVVSFTDGETGAVEGRGSGRSIPGIHLAQAFIDARNEGLLEKGGGHAMAGGFTIAPDKLEVFYDFLMTHIDKQMRSHAANIETAIDGVLSVRGARTDFVRLIHDHVGPFGQAHEEPLFLLQDVRIHAADIVGESHIRTLISDPEGGTRMKAMAFRAVGTPLGDALLTESRRAFHMLGHLKINNWGGRDKVEMHIKDAAFAEGEKDIGERVLSVHA